MSEPRAGYRVKYTGSQAAKSALNNEVRRLAAVEQGCYSAPEPELIRALTDQMEWSQIRVAELLRVNVSTVRRWTACREQQQYSEIPFSAWYLLLHFAGVASLDRLAA